MKVEAFCVKPWHKCSTGSTRRLPHALLLAQSWILGTWLLGVPEVGTVRAVGTREKQAKRFHSTPDYFMLR